MQLNLQTATGVSEQLGAVTMHEHSTEDQRAAEVLRPQEL